MESASILTVTQITEHIKAILSEDSLLGDLWLSGEVSNFKLAASGHCYFTLKDQTSSIKTVIWRSSALRLQLPRDGDAVVAHGYISVYEQQGVYQFYCDHLEPAGAGQLWAQFERLKARLADEGLFDPANKRPIPARPRRIGIATSPNAAALRDILRTVAARNPLVEIILAPTPVQGENAPEAISAAVAALNRWSVLHGPLDCLIVARGGGSIEELWSFNDERVARALARSEVPVISGVGHETDFTIADFVADLRAPTPTGAAVMAVPDIRDFAAAVTQLRASGEASVRALLIQSRTRLATYQDRLLRLSPTRRLANDRQRIDDLARRGTLAMRARLTEARSQTRALQLHLRGLDPTRTLARGYAIVSRPTGEVIASRAQVSAGEQLRVRVADGQFPVQVQPPDSDKR